MATRSTIALLPALLAGLAALPATTALAETAADTPRSTLSREVVRGGRDGRPGEATRHEYGPLATTGARRSRTGTSDKLAAASAKSRDDFWFYTADVELFNDDDRDGYYHGIDLLFDVDTYYDSADVYVAVFLSYQGGPWNEYAVTGDFTVNGATSDDEYVIVTELESGFPTGDYDLLIELYDAYDGSFLAEFGPADTSELALLPLEDFQRDDPRSDVIVIGRGGGGATWLAGLVLIPLWRALARRRAPRA